MELNWTTPIGAVSYNLYRSVTSGSGYSQVNSSPITNPSYTDTGLTDGTTYYYVVTGLDSDGNESGYSVEVSAKPTNQPVAAPAAPTNLAATYSGSLGITISGRNPTQVQQDT